MESRIPLPTDNINKFYALFGLALFIACLLSVVWLVNSNNEKIYTLLKDVLIISPSISDKDDQKFFTDTVVSIVERQKRDRQFLTSASGVIAGVSFLLMLHGFRKWHTEIQPKQDEIFALQIKKLKLEIKEAESQ